jgi:hypothetical protein
MLLKILIVGAVAIGVMAAIKDGRVLKDAGLLSTCNAVATSSKSDPNLMKCTKGKLDGFPDLTNKSCTLIAVGKHHEVWRCAAPVVSSQTPTG